MNSLFQKQTMKREYTIHKKDYKYFYNYHTYLDEGNNHCIIYYLVPNGYVDFYNTNDFNREFKIGDKLLINNEILTIEKLIYKADGLIYRVEEYIEEDNEENKNEIISKYNKLINTHENKDKIKLNKKSWWKFWE